MPAVKNSDRSRWATVGRGGARSTLGHGLGPPRGGRARPRPGSVPNRSDRIRTIAEVCARAGEWRHKHGVELVCVDYFQLLNAEGATRYEQLSPCSRRLKALAKELDIAILLTAQIARQIAREVKREKRFPQLSDLRDCGRLEQGADAVIFIYRIAHATTAEDEHLLIVPKNRGGPARGQPMALTRVDGATYGVGEGDLP